MKLKATLGARKSTVPTDGNRIINEGMSVRFCMSDEERALSICVVCVLLLFWFDLLPVSLACFVSYFLLFFLSFFLPVKKVVAWRISFAFPGLGGVSGSVWYGMVIPGVVA